MDPSAVMVQHCGADRPATESGRPAGGTKFYEKTILCVDDGSRLK